MKPTPPFETLKEHFGMFIQNDKHVAPHFMSLFFTQCNKDAVMGKKKDPAAGRIFFFKACFCPIMDIDPYR